MYIYCWPNIPGVFSVHLKNNVTVNIKRLRYCLMIFLRDSVDERCS